MNVHDKTSKAGKFNFSFMEKGEKETATPKSKQPAGTYPIGSGSEGKNAKPTQPAGSLIK